MNKMIKINFYPDSDREDFSESISGYEKAWAENGAKIVEAYERISGLKFRETMINAIIHAKRSQSHPLSLRNVTDPKIQRDILVHEMGHRLLSKRFGEIKRNSLDNHKILDLLLYDVVADLYGEDTAKEFVVWESKPRPDIPDDYKIAWQWALKFNRDERAEKFKEILENKPETIE